MGKNTNKNKNKNHGEEVSGEELDQIPGDETSADDAPPADETDPAADAPQGDEVAKANHVHKPQKGERWICTQYMKLNGIRYPKTAVIPHDLITKEMVVKKQVIKHG